MREFCQNKGLTVEAKEGKRGIPIRKDYMNSVKHYLENCEEKYRAEAIVREYGIRIIRLPPYHPELNPIGKLLLKVFKAPLMSIIYIHSQSFTFIRNHLHSFTIIYIHSQSFIYIRNNLHLFTIIYIHSHSFTITHIHS